MNDAPMVIFLERTELLNLGVLPNGALQLELKDGRLVTVDEGTARIISAHIDRVDSDAIGKRALEASLIPPPDVQARLRATEECPDAIAGRDPRFRRIHGGRRS